MRDGHYFKCLLSRWRVEEKRNINYRSLAPIISLLGVSHTRECQLWAAWAVANLTLFDEDKYCPLVEEEVTSYYRVSQKSGSTLFLPICRLLLSFAAISESNFKICVPNFSKLP